MTESPAERLDTFASRRRDAALSPQGSLALINTQWITEPTDVWGAAGRWAPRSDGGSGLVVTADPHDGVTVDGVVVDGETIVRGKDDPEPSVIQFSETVTAPSSPGILVMDCAYLTKTPTTPQSFRISTDTTMPRNGWSRRSGEKYLAER